MDSTLSDGDMMRLAFSLRGLDTSRIVFTTAPYLGTGSVDGQSIVRLNESLGRGFWLAFGYDSLPAFMRAHVLHRSAHRRLDTTVPAAGCRSCAEHGPAPPVAGHSAPWEIPLADQDFNFRPRCGPQG